jgi:hypothetical protein
METVINKTRYVVYPKEKGRKELEEFMEKMREKE